MHTHHLSCAEDSEVQRGREGCVLDFDGEIIKRTISVQVLVALFPLSLRGILRG